MGSGLGLGWGSGNLGRENHYGKIFFLFFFNFLAQSINNNILDEFLMKNFFGEKFSLSRRYYLSCTKL